MAKKLFTAEKACAMMQLSSSSGEEDSDSGSDWIPVDSGSLSDSDSSSEPERAGPSSKRARFGSGVQSNVAARAISSDSNSETEGPSERRGGRIQPRVREREAVPFQIAHPQWLPPNMEEPQIPPFTAASGIMVDTGNMSPINFFQMFVPDEFLQYIVEQTNNYAAQYFAANPTSVYVTKWTPTNLAELRIFLGLVLNMGLTWRPQLSMYWSRNALHQSPQYSGKMPMLRYKMLMRFLHFNNNAEDLSREDPSRDRLFKLRPLLDHLNTKFSEIYVPEREIAVDESLMPYQGRLGIKQYIPTKRARYGVKLYKLCESSTGYTYSFRIYEGKDRLLQPEGCPAYMGTNGKIVVGLISPLLNKGYHLYLDNFYTSVPLFKFLFDAQTVACGTLRANRKGLPEEVVHKKLKKGEMCSLRSSELLVMKYKDKRDVLMLTTMHTEAMMSVRSQRQETEKPQAILDYSKYMGAVDFSDQMLSYYLNVDSEAMTMKQAGWKAHWRTTGNKGEEEGRGQKVEHKKAGLHSECFSP
ncbi:piggyBac transposable element-derived protein 4-like [Hyperolius riggenbachi]|uniref:piggyBac transposable element-derived protein 4-like n=1 Tax=Hyperolius riggenbachi TaxID=752182 RepID=UPI0035A39AFD